ncbi:MAG: SCO family protein [Proteobacteria bacterium]|nr:SCO family protein [Pseudomonadota bacterium]
MSRIDPSALDGYPLPIASLFAVAAAIFILTVWEPLQQRSLSEETRAAATPAAAWIDTTFTTSDGNATTLSASNGHVRIVTMMYAHCPGVCPMSMATLKRIEYQLSATEREQLRLVALTLDPEQDSVATLATFRQEHGLNSARWTLGRPSSVSVARIAAGLGIAYRPMPDGTIDHRGEFALLDASGRIIAKTSNTQNPDPRFVAQVRHALEQ